MSPCTTLPCPLPTFIDQRLAVLLERPNGWGPPIAVELQLLLLVEMRHVIAGMSPNMTMGIMDRYRHYLEQVLGTSSLSCAGHLGLTTRADKRFTAVLQGFVDAERALDSRPS